MTMPDPEARQGVAVDGDPGLPNPGWGPLSALPGNPLMWVLILSELLVFAAFFGLYAWQRALEPQAFIAGQRELSALWGGVNTLVLVTSGLAAAMAVRECQLAHRAATRRWLLIAMALGATFCVIKGIEYGGKFAHGLTPESTTFFTFYFGLTGFHAAHVVFGLCLLGIAAWRPQRDTVVTVCAFWHMVDLIWVLLYPLLYLLR
ncbi:cytochrome c oxidase subunit 3 family protein [Halomonas sp. V046]|uniref:cytochrome c oxidase subunit 3 family protein n=1 Tax=Halomonas sp. V046 TaxID=3459611 RepID=UPI0040443B7A